MDVLTELGALALASRLKRLSDRLMKDVSSVYHDCDIDFEPRWFTTLYTLSKNKRMSITDLADALSISHTAVNQFTTELIRRGWVFSEKGIRDERRRLISLTSEGKKIVKKLQPIWGKIRSATEELIRDAKCDIIADLNLLELQLDQKEMYTRIRMGVTHYIKQQVEILEYKSAYKKYFQSLNHEWLKEYFYIEPPDEKVLMDPRGQIIHPGGAVFFARLNGKIVGTCALIKHKSDVYELTKMAVTRSVRGLGIGRQLGQAVIHRASNLGVEVLYLQTSSRLVSANRLYHKLGFRRLGNGPLDNNLYDRETYTMRLSLK